MAVHCMHLLVASSSHLCKKHAIATMDYGEVAQHALESYGPLWLRQRSHLGTVETSNQRLQRLSHNLWRHISIMGKFSVKLTFFPFRLEMCQPVHIDHSVWILLLLLCVYVSKYSTSGLRIFTQKLNPSQFTEPRECRKCGSGYHGPPGNSHVRHLFYPKLGLV